MTGQDINAAANLARLADWNGNDNDAGILAATDNVCAIPDGAQSLELVS